MFYKVQKAEPPIQSDKDDYVSTPIAAIEPEQQSTDQVNNSNKYIVGIEISISPF